MASRIDGIALADPHRMDCTVKKGGRNRRTDKRKYAGSSWRSAGYPKAKRSTGLSDEPGRLRLRIEAVIRRIPKGKVSTYGAVARAAGFPHGARLVARVLRGGFELPWQRVLGAGGQIRLQGDSAMEQRFRLESEGVRFHGRKVDMKTFEFKFGRARGRQELMW